MVKIKVADICVQINNRYPEMERLCKGYETDEPPVFQITVSSQEIEEERRAQNYGFSQGYLETVCAYRKLAMEMLRHNVFIMHASIVEVDGQGYAFLAHSGTGKTTQTRLWLEWFKDRARVINGDKPLIRIETKGDHCRFVAYGTPWCGKEGLGCNASVPLKAMFLLERALEPSCEPASEEYVVDRLFHQLLMPEAPEQVMSLLAIADQLVQSVPAYLLRCNMKPESVVKAYCAANQQL